MKLHLASVDSKFGICAQENCPEKKLGLFLSLFHPSDMFQKSVRCFLIMGAFLIWVSFGGFLWERFLLVGSFGKGVFWKRVLWKGNLIGLCLGSFINHVATKGGRGG